MIRKDCFLISWILNLASQSAKALKKAASLQFTWNPSPLQASKLPPRSAPKASLSSSLDFKWCFSDGVYRGVATPFAAPWKAVRASCHPSPSLKVVGIEGVPNQGSPRAHCALPMQWRDKEGGQGIISWVHHPDALISSIAWASSSKCWNCWWFPRHRLLFLQGTLAVRRYLRNFARCAGTSTFGLLELMLASLALPSQGKIPQQLLACTLVLLGMELQ